MCLELKSFEFFCYFIMDLFCFIKICLHNPYHIFSKDPFVFFQEVELFLQSFAKKKQQKTIGWMQKSFHEFCNNELCHL